MLPLSSPSKLGRYEIVDEIGKGAMGVVYLARDPLIGRLVALKTFRIGYSVRDAELEQFRARFIREAQSAGILSHPNIVTIHDVVERGEEGLAFIAMEYVRGTNLKSVLQEPQRPTLPYVVEILSQIADGLDYAHSCKVIHRDIKPANILITTDNRAKITDFGIARLDTSNLTQEGQLLGTPNYMSPEQILGRDVDSRADIFSLGVVLYEMVTRHKPFQGENLTMVSHRIVYDQFTPPREYVNDLPPGCEQILAKALEKDPARRYQRARDLADDLRKVLGSVGARDVLNETQSLSSTAMLPAERVPPGVRALGAAAPMAPIAPMAPMTPMEQSAAAGATAAGAFAAMPAAPVPAMVPAGGATPAGPVAVPAAGEPGAKRPFWRRRSRGEVPAVPAYPHGTRPIAMPSLGAPVAAAAGLSAAPVPAGSVPPPAVPSSSASPHLHQVPAAGLPGASGGVVAGAAVPVPPDGAAASAGPLDAVPRGAASATGVPAAPNVASISGVQPAAAGPAGVAGTAAAPAATANSAPSPAAQPRPAHSRGFLGRPSAAGLAVAALVGVLAGGGLAAAALYTARPRQPGAAVEARWASDEAARVRLAGLVRDGRARLDAGDTAGALAAFRAAEQLAPGRRGLRALLAAAGNQESAQRQRIDQERQIGSKLDEGRQALRDRRFDEAEAAALAVLAVSPGNTVAGAILEEARSGRARRRDLQPPPPSTAVAPAAAGAAAPPLVRPDAHAQPPAPGPAQEAKDATIEWSFFSQLPQGSLMIYVNGRPMLRQQFRFYEKGSFFRSRPTSGTLSGGFHVTPGPVEIRVYVTPEGSAAVVTPLPPVTLAGGASRRLDVRLTSDGQVTAKLN